MGIINKRIFVEKREGFQIEKSDLLKDLNENLKLGIKDLRVLLVYDVFNIDEDVLNRANKTVFTESMVDELVDIDLEGKCYLAIETLPGQYDQRADSARQCVGLLNPETKCTIASGQVFLLEGEFSLEEENRIRTYLINPIEARE